MLKSKIEAILFLTDKPMRAQAIARIVNEDVQTVRQSILELIHDYEERQSGLEIADDNGYIIQVKDEYASITDEFVPMEMPLSLLRTLSAIAIKQPVAQSEIIKIRGAGAYDHIKELINRELILKKEDGRSPLLSTTKKFQEYFRLSHDAKSLRTELRKEEKTEADVPANISESIQLDVSQVFMVDAAEARPISDEATSSEPSSGIAKGTDGDAHRISDSGTGNDASPMSDSETLEALFRSSPDASLIYRAPESHKSEDDSWSDQSST
jgi:segregation and condensation protein B